MATWSGWKSWASGAEVVQVALGKHRIAASAVLALIVTGLVAWWMRDEPPTTVPPPTPTSAQRPAAAFESETVPQQRMQASASVPTVFSRPGEVEVCGLGYLAASTRLDQLSPKSRAQLDQTSADLIERLQRSGSARARSASLLLRVIVTLEDERAASAEAEYAACREGSNANLKHENGSPCNLAQLADAQLTARYVDRVTPYVTELATVASTSEDPAVYAQAIQACARLPAQNQPPACGTAISLEQWARLEPGNMLPWLRLVGERTQSAATEALYRASLGTFEIGRAHV